MTADEFRAKFTVDEVVASGGPRSKLRITEITESYVSVIPVKSKLQAKKRLWFAQLTAVVNGFSRIKRMTRDTQRVLIAAGLKKETTTENYLYGFAREWLKRSCEVVTIFPDDISPALSVWEGARKTTIVNAYERSDSARQACIAYWKSRCQICDMSFLEAVMAFAPE